MVRTKKKKAAVTKYLHISIFFISLFMPIYTMAQEVVISSGANTSDNGGSVSYSVGQVVCQHSNGVEGSVAAGVQQAYIIDVSTSIVDNQRISLLASAYPNPSTDFLILEVNELKLSALRFHLTDVNGRILQIKNITADKTNIPMGNLTPATYFLKVIMNDSEVKVFKIIKK
jgi:hypothetical protein